MRLFSYASPEGTQDKPRGSTHKNVGRVQSAEQHIITVAHVICVAITLNRGALRNQIIDVTVGISSQSFVFSPSLTLRTLARLLRRRNAFLDRTQSPRDQALGGLA